MAAIGWLTAMSVSAQAPESDVSHTLYDFAPRKLVDLPTAGTLPRGNFQLGLRIYAGGGALGYADIGLSDRFSLGISYGGTDIVSNEKPEWNPRIGFNLKLRLVDELEFFPAITVGFTDQGYGTWDGAYERYTYKSRGFYGVLSRSFYFYKWTSGWHFGINHSREYQHDHDKDINFFGGFDATFNYNLAILTEYDAALNDNKGDTDHVTGKGRGYLNVAVKWLFADNLELELLFKDLLLNRWESESFTREVRMMYIDSF